ncbi:ubiquinone anaerobic biosynthesis protein UbiV [Tropicimonas sp.]|uniref:ubiquinone anaerobic biosynthesis protein UbiV n=1 Tax=Tropicimonas sp. TaxID=2067044 RepID=UPI003A89F44E
MSVRLTLGPIAYHWTAERKRDFYARIADEAPVDTVYLGEVICSKRQPFFDSELPEMAERLAGAGKTVVMSGLAEVMLPRERQASKALAELDDYEIEINNAAGLFHRSGRPHRVGPFLNVYGEQTLRELARRGATHVCLPTELPGTATVKLAAAARELAVGVEVQVFGRASLATSARCYHARAYKRTKDNCQFVCEEHPDGMPLETRDGQSFLRVNGIQTQSDTYVSLLDEVAGMASCGITDLRLMPQDVDMAAVAGVFRQHLDGGIDAAEGQARLEQIAPGIAFSNGFWHGEAGYRRIARAERALA